MNTTPKIKVHRLQRKLKEQKSISENPNGTLTSQIGKFFKNINCNNVEYNTPKTILKLLLGSCFLYLLSKKKTNASAFSKGVKTGKSNPMKRKLKGKIASKESTYEERKTPEL